MPGAPAPRTTSLAALCCAALLTACGSGEGSEAAGGATGSSSSGSSSAAAPSPSTAAADQSALVPGLLPAEAFGEEATVVPIDREQLELGAGLAAEPESLDVSPESCADAVASTQPQIADYEDVAAQTAQIEGTTTVELLLQGAATEGSVQQLLDAAAACPEARISSPELGEATLVFETLDVPDLGDGAAAVRYTTTLSQGGQEVSVPALVGLVIDGDRQVTLLTIAADGSSPDVAEFTSLLQRAFESQAEALG